MAQWMIKHHKQNPYYTHWDKVLDVREVQCADANSAGDGLRPGCLADASDAAQFAELKTLGELTKRRQGRVVVEGPGHVPFDQIEMNVKKEMETLMSPSADLVLSLPTSPTGYDHITSAIGATMAGTAGAAMLCYVTPKEHLGVRDERCKARPYCVQLRRTLRTLRVIAKVRAAATIIFTRALCLSLERAVPSFDRS